MTRYRRLAAVNVIVALSVVTSASLRLAAPSGLLDALTRADRARLEALANQQDIIAALRAIAANLASGETLDMQSARIRRLTADQRKSLETLVAVLKVQLRSLRRTGVLLQDTGDAARSIARLGRRQTIRLQRALDALRVLRDVAAQAAAASARLAVSTRYGARLARDSYRAFRGP